MKRSNPGRLDWGAGEALSEVEDVWVERSGPPQTSVIRVSTENASFAVGKSLMSFAKCSMVEMTVSNVG